MDMEINQKKRVKKNFDDSSEGESSSSSSSSASSNPTQFLETRQVDFNEKKKADPPNSPGHGSGSGSEVKEASINDLPSEMLTKILENVDTASLFSCRLQNRQWNEISIRFLTTRSNSALEFRLIGEGGDEGKIFLENYQGSKPMINKRLKDFVKCMKKSKSCPYAYFNFYFQVNSPAFWHNKSWLKFISHFTAVSNSNLNSNSNQGPKTGIKGLGFVLDYDDATKEDLILVTEKLRDLLVNKIPHLEEFRFDFDQNDELGFDADEIKLFPPSQNTEPVRVSVQLPHLKSVTIDNSMLSNLEGIVGDVLSAAVNLKKLNVHVTRHHDFSFLQSLGKLHLLKKAEFHLEQDFFWGIENDKNFTSMTLPKLEFLKLYMMDERLISANLSPGISFLNRLFESSKDTLRSLNVRPLGFLPALQLPTFKNLRTLKMSLSWMKNSFPHPIFPPGTKSLDIFPAVNLLHLGTGDWEAGFRHQDSVPVLPNVKHLRVKDDLYGNFTFTPACILGLASMCPNLKSFHIQKDDYRPRPFFPFCQGAPQIWTQMIQLESLVVDVDVGCRNMTIPALDSCFTGISKENCRQLYHLMSGDKGPTSIKAAQIKIRIPKSQLLQLIQRVHPSILDMKGLKKLTINPFYKSERQEDKNLLFKKMTWIAEEYAFKLMPQLEVDGRGRGLSTASTAS